jgi:hypothetical protein
MRTPDQRRIQRTVPWTVLCALAGMFACTSTRTFQRPLNEAALAELKEELPPRAEVTWSEGSISKQEPASGISVRGAHATWVHALTSEKREVPEEALRSIEWTSRSRGVGQGFLVGGIGAAALGAALGFASGNDPACGREVFFCFRSTAPEKAFAAGVIGLLGGGLVGALIGAAVGSPTRIDFLPR